MTEQLIPGLGMMDLERMRANLAAWREHAHDALQRQDWTAAYVHYPHLDLREVAPPLVAPPRDIRQARIMFIGSAGIYAHGQTPFDAANPLGDYTFRMLPADFDVDSAHLAHNHYKHDAADRDRNAVYPLARLRELVAAGEIGSLTDSQIAFMGYQPDYVQLIEQFIPALVEATLAQRPDAALLVPV